VAVTGGQGQAFEEANKIPKAKYSDDLFWFSVHKNE
jgi:hypothetical protein